MTRTEIITELSKYFTIRELVCNHTYTAFGDKSWMFLRTELLHTLLIVRTRIINRPMTINAGVSFQRGLRCNLCKLVKARTMSNDAYLSAHVLGGAVDFTPNDISAETARLMIKNNQDKLPYPIRLEANVPWVHMDVYDDGNEKVTMFNP